MAKVRTLILRGPGTNCDEETAFAFRQAGTDVTSAHVNRLISHEQRLADYQVLVIPGGFTYGDDIASGKILANELNRKLKKDLGRFVGAGKPIIGICNGFQVLVKAGLLPGIEPGKIQSTLTLNDSGKFEDRWVYLKGQGSRVKGQGCIWTKGLPEMIYLPVAHGEGKFIPKDESVRRKLWDNGQVVFQYADEAGGSAGYPFNPNGSVDDIAGICDTTGRIFGLMPHPERHVSYQQHPRRQSAAGASGDGLAIFRNAVEYAKHNL